MDTLCMFNKIYSELIMWTFYACLNNISKVGHVDALCMFNKAYSELIIWTFYACLNNISKVGHVDPLCIFNKIFLELIMWTLYACLIKYIFRVGVVLEFRLPGHFTFLWLRWPSRMHIYSSVGPFNEGVPGHFFHLMKAPTMRLQNAKMLLCWPSRMHIYGFV